MLQNGSFLAETKHGMALAAYNDTLTCDMTTSFSLHTPLLLAPPYRTACPSLSGQLFLMDRFLGGTFFTFGVEVISFALRDDEDRIDPVIYVFPRMTKVMMVMTAKYDLNNKTVFSFQCTFHKFGTSGEVEKHDALCLLPLNIVNEKVYIFLWFW